MYFQDEQVTAYTTGSTSATYWERGLRIGYSDRPLSRSLSLSEVKIPILIRYIGIGEYCFGFRSIFFDPYWFVIVDQV